MAGRDDFLCAAAGRLFGEALGGSAGVTANNGVAIGYQSVVAHATSVAIGKSATTTAANQIRLGTAAETVSLPGIISFEGGKRDICNSNVNAISWTNAQTWFQTNADFTLAEWGTAYTRSYTDLEITNSASSNIVMTTPWNVFVASANVTRSTHQLLAGRSYKFRISYDGNLRSMDDLRAPNDLQLSVVATNAYLAWLVTNAPKNVTLGITNSTTTAAKITELDYPLGVGLYYFRYAIRCGSSATGTGFNFGVNYTGNSTGVTYIRTHVTGGTSAVSGVSEPNASPLTGQLVEGMATNALSTTAFNLVNGGVRVANVYQLNIVEGLIETTTAGNLELYHGSETAAATYVGRGTKLMVWQ